MRLRCPRSRSARSVAGPAVDTQNECLKILGVAGGDPPGANAKKFAEIVGAGVLAGELSLIGALAAQHLARAHQELGRGARNGRPAKKLVLFFPARTENSRLLCIRPL